MGPAVAVAPAAMRASATISGSGEVAIDVSRALDAHVSGAGTITYHGDPTELSKDVSGSGRVVKR